MLINGRVEGEGVEFNGSLNTIDLLGALDGKGEREGVIDFVEVEVCVSEIGGDFELDMEGEGEGINKEEVGVVVVDGEGVNEAEGVGGEEITSSSTSKTFREKRSKMSIKPRKK